MPLNYNGYTASIRCNGRELESYKVERKGSHLSCWVASEAGKKFTIHWGDAVAQTSMQVIIFVDGREMARSAHMNQYEGSAQGVSETPGQQRAFVFAPLVLTDDDKVTSSRDKPHEKLGTIEIVMRLVQSYIPSGRAYAGQGPVPEIGPVHEKSKKAGVHAVSLGPPEKTHVPMTFMPIGIEDCPFAVFTFYYRPLALLQANDIAPRPPPSPPKSKKRRSEAQHTPLDGANTAKRPRVVAGKSKAHSSDDEDDDADRVVFLREQIVMLQDRLQREEAKLSPKKAVKREPSPVQIPEYLQGDIIELTDDEDDIIDLTQ